MRRVRGWASRVAILDGYRRQVLAWARSNTREARGGVDGLAEARRHDDRPSLCNTDPGSPCTRAAVTGVRQGAGVASGRDGRGRALDHLVVERRWRRVTHEDGSRKG